MDKLDLKNPAIQKIAVSALLALAVLGVFFFTHFLPFGYLPRQEKLVAQGHSISTRVIAGQPGVFQSYNALIDSEPVTLTVRPLPKEGQLPGFTGAIGAFQLEAPKLSTNEVRAGDPLTLTVTLHGEGNLGRLTLPQLPLLRDWQSFPPVGDPSPSYIILQRGFATFSYTLIPLSDRSKATPAIPFSYFDPKKGAYADLTVPPVPLTIKPAPPGAVAQLKSSPPIRTSDTDESATREREYVLTGLAETPGRSVSSLAPLQRRWWFLGLQLVPAAALGGFWALERRRRYLEQHPEIIRKRRAHRGLRRHLRLARRASAARDAAGFVSGAINALREVCAPHCAANPQASARRGTNRPHRRLGLGLRASQLGRRAQRIGLRLPAFLPAKSEALSLA